MHRHRARLLREGPQRRLPAPALSAARDLGEGSRLIRTPYRLSLFGGGTDYPHWFLRHGGAALGASLARYCFVWVSDASSGAAPFPPHEQHKQDAILSACGWGERRPTLRRRHGLPPRSGLGGSSALTVGLLHASHAAMGRGVTREDLAREAIDVEHRLLREEVGCQDPILVALGGLRRIDFHTDGSYACTAVPLSRDRQRYLESRLLLVHVGAPRTRNMAARTALAAATETGILHEIRDLVDASYDLLVDASSDLDQLGPLLHRTWELKRRLTRGITNDTIDAFYGEALRAGATGGKLLGAGGGGFLLLHVPTERRAQVLHAVGGNLSLPVRFDFSGTTVVAPPAEGEISRGSFLPTPWGRAGS